MIGLSRTPCVRKCDVIEFSSIPDIPVFRPTEEEFQNFTECISKIEARGAHHVGLCKIIPPSSWVPRQAGYSNIDGLVIKKPIFQTTIGSRGIYLQNILPRKDILLKDFKRLAGTSPYATPRHMGSDDLEKKYWSSIGLVRPLYGANVSGSLMDIDQTLWNISNLNSILNDILTEESVKIPGVNTPYLYYGMWRSTFPWHVEDVELYSINYLHFGSPKFWYVIPPSFARKFESFVFEYFRSEFLSCRSFLRHKCVLINPAVLSKAGIPTRKVVQRCGEIMITFPYGYHAGFNMGFNIAESTNFALPRWIDYGKKAIYCNCWDDTVKICMDPFVKKYQPSLYNSWRDGVDVTPHPLDEYCVNDRCDLKDPPRSEISGRRNAFDFVTNMLVSIGDLNLIDLRFSLKRFRQANLPYHITHNARLDSLWCANKYDEVAERQFNQLVGSYWPHCAICSFLWAPQHFAKILCGLAARDKSAIPNEPYIPEVAYCRSYKSAMNLILPSEVKSEIMQCAHCCVSVHARCYGVNESKHSVVSTEDDSRIKHEDTAGDIWLCDACRAPVKPSCVFCYIRGGAMKILANPNNNFTGRAYWAHIVCLLASPGCYFMDITKRLAFVSSESIHTALMNGNVDFSSSDESVSSEGSRYNEKISAFKKSRSVALEERTERLSTSKVSRTLDLHPKPVAKRLSMQNGHKQSSLSTHSTKICTVCRLPGRGCLPLASCWHHKCGSHFHVTCAQMAGVMIGTDVYPRFFYIACDRHPTNYHHHNVADLDPVFPGDDIMVRESCNPPKFSPAVAIKAVTPLYCRISFPDGTFTVDTPPEYLSSVNWLQDGLPPKGTTVNVLWDDNREYVGTFEGTTSEKWQVKYESGKVAILNRERFYVKSKTANT